MHNLAVSKAGSKLLQGHANARDVFKNRGIRQHSHIVFCKVDAGFQQRDQFHQLLLDGLEPFGERAFELLCRDLRLVESLSVDQVADGFGLGEIDASIQKGPHGELARFSQASAGGDAHRDDVPQDYWRSVGGDFDDVVGSVGVRLREVGDDDFVDARSSRASLLGRTAPSTQFRASLGGCPHVDLRWLYKFSEHCASRFQFMLQPQHRQSNLSRSWASEADDADTAATGGRRDGNDSIVKIHGAIVAPPRRRLAGWRQKIIVTALRLSRSRLSVHRTSALPDGTWQLFPRDRAEPA